MNDNFVDRTIIEVKMIQSANCSDNGLTLKFRKKGSIHKGPIHFLSGWIANGWAKPTKKGEIDEADNSPDDSKGDGE